VLIHQLSERLKLIENDKFNYFKLILTLPHV
jgi:hypothetical protein